MTQVGQLSPGERQLVEIARALHNEASLLIFDEPTTSLTPRETERLFATIEGLKAEGRTIIYISHILSDVQRLSDEILVLRDGQLVEQGTNEDLLALNGIYANLWRVQTGYRQGKQLII